MKFYPGVQFPDGSDFTRSTTLARWSSTGGQWRLQADCVLFGVRLHLLRNFAGGAFESAEARWGGYEVVYCMGAARLTLLGLPHIVMKILADIEEDSDVEMVRALFPQQIFKPLHRDRACWRSLCEKAGVPELINLDLLSMGEEHVDLFGLNGPARSPLAIGAGE